MKNTNTLEKYRKEKPETSPKQTYSIFIEKKQVAFIKKHSLNLSKLVRKILNDLMLENSKPKK